MGLARIRHGFAIFGSILGEPVTVIGPESLCNNYLTAFDYLGVPAGSADTDTTVSGFHKIIFSSHSSFVR